MNPNMSYSSLPSVGISTISSISSLAAFVLSASPVPNVSNPFSSVSNIFAYTLLCVSPMFSLNAAIASLIFFIWNSFLFITHVVNRFFPSIKYPKCFWQLSTVVLSSSVRFLISSSEKYRFLFRYSSSLLQNLTCSLYRRLLILFLLMHLLLTRFCLLIVACSFISILSSFCFYFFLWYYFSFYIF